MQFRLNFMFKVKILFKYGNGCDIYLYLYGNLKLSLRLLSTHSMTRFLCVRRSCRFTPSFGSHFSQWATLITGKAIPTIFTLLQHDRGEDLNYALGVLGKRKDTTQLRLCLQE
jgi:hypothetical protein